MWFQICGNNNMLVRKVTLKKSAKKLKHKKLKNLKSHFFSTQFWRRIKPFFS